MPSAERPSQRAWQRERTREVLRAVAVSLFERDGYDAVTVEQIAAAAGVSSRTFFRYFPSKDEVLFEPTTSSDPHVVAALVGAPAKLGPVAAMRHVLHELLDPQVVGDIGVLVRGLRVAVSTPSLRPRLGEILHLSEGLLADALTERLGPARRRHAELAAAAIMAVERTVLARWAEDGGSGDLRVQLDAGLAALEHGFA